MGRKHVISQQQTRDLGLLYQEIHATGVRPQPEINWKAICHTAITTVWLFIFDGTAPIRKQHYADQYLSAYYV